MRHLAVLNGFFQDIEGLWIFQGCGMVQRKVRHFRSYSHKIRWGFEFWGRWKGRSQRLCLWIMVRLWCRWHRWSTCMFRWSCIAISLHFLIGKSLFSMTQAGPDAGDRFCQRANQELSGLLDVSRQWYTRVFGVRDCQRSLENARDNKMLIS